MIFKEAFMQKEFDHAPILLKIIVSDLEGYCRSKFNKDITITRILGKVSGDSGVHAEYRAADIRDEHDGNHEFTSQEVEEILTYLNTKYARNDGKPTAIHHSFDGMPYHIHVQIASLNSAYIQKG